MESRVPRSLFEPYGMKGLVIKNRLMRSPMVLSMAAADGTVTADLLHMYRAAAEGGVGLCCTGCMAVNADARMNWQQLGVWADHQIPGLAGLVDTVHTYGEGCTVFGQIFSEGAHSWGYSYGQDDAGLNVNSLSEERIWEIVEAFAASAVRVREAGFDGVHLHGGHGYLISQFLSPATNERTDRWGGSMEGRAAFALAICQAIRKRVGTDYPLGIKMNTADYLPRGHWQAETAHIARLLAEAGVDLIEMSGGMGYMIELREALRRRAGEKEYYFWDAIPPFTDALAGTGVALAAVGGIRTPAVMDQIRSLGIDFISMARPWLCEPAWPTASRPATCDPRNAFRAIDSAISVWRSSAKARCSVSGSTRAIAAWPARSSRTTPRTWRTWRPASWKRRYVSSRQKIPLPTR